MSKNILIVNSYASAPSYGGGMYRHYYLAKEFNKMGYKTTIASASFSHLFTKFPVIDKSKTFTQEIVDGVDFIWLKSSKYKNSFDKKRVFTWFEFMFKLFFITKILKHKPDVIICSPTEVFSIIPCYFLAKKFKAKLVFEVRDIWPLSLIEIGKISKFHPFIMLMSLVEKFAIKKSDLLVSNLCCYDEHVKELNIFKPFYWISNGISLEHIAQAKELPLNIKNLIPKDKFIIGYTGKLGISNAMIYLIKAAKILKEHKNLTFVIVGDGSEKNTLKDEAKDLENVIFIDPIKKEQISQMLALFDVCYIGLLDKELFKFGVSPNKLYDYMYVAKPVLESINTKNSIVKISQCGKCVKAQDENEIAKAILQLSNTPKQELQNMGKNGKEYILKHFTYDKLAQKYIEILQLHSSPF
ncbi:glycosyltransferase family 4 protein [Campylobacter hyointestinalis]|uniref:glycosyltransferase family 4 protein n=1 Tax=Campylobacter hyointestinalis TaxID=198 RepID=UPI000DCE624E|nr:glycosyltransferase family 4 protein [Campylobacter hyointestinalis]RAZ55866.1 glycosyltransferase WbuB [Campylobacter hyointestinalis subsp. lawsonii]RAZ63149.1 glycosyltransferase WbuB [Campylobacter hyointestinalis subsp. lawsonii]